MSANTLEKLEIKGIGDVHCGALIVDDAILLAELFGAEKTLSKVSKSVGNAHRAIFAGEEIQFSSFAIYESEITNCGVSLYPNAARMLIYQQRFCNATGSIGSDFWSIVPGNDKNEESRLLWHALKEISPICLLANWREFILGEMDNHQNKYGIRLEDKQGCIRNGLVDKRLYRLALHPDNGKQLFCDAITEDIKSGALAIPKIAQKSLSEVQKRMLAKRTYSSIQGYNGPKKETVTLADIL